MHTKTEPDEIQSFLSDASNMLGGHASRILFPETIEEVAAILVEATHEQTPVTVSGAGTGLVGGRVPFGGIVLATTRLNKIKEIVCEDNGGWVVAESGVILADVQRTVATKGLLYPPDPTEWSCYLGGTVATNASGPRTFKYGPTRAYVRRLKIVLATGDILDLKRGEIYAGANGELRVPLPSGRIIDAQLPTYQMPATRKHVAGYFVAPGMDLVDLFIGSEGTLGVVVEIEVRLIPKPQGVLSGVVFFKSEDDLLELVRAARLLSLRSRTSEHKSGIDARALEFFDSESLKFLRTNFPSIPTIANGALFFEQETTTDTEEEITSGWYELLERHYALVDESWFATNERDGQRLREFRHALPVLVNEWLSHHKQRKVSTDMALPDDEFRAMLRFYQASLRDCKLQYVIFGHIGDNHVHVNILPRDEEEAARARDLYGRFIQRAVKAGGTISAEHGIGKLKRNYLGTMYGQRHIDEMAALKQAFDPAGILGQGNIFDTQKPLDEPSPSRHWKRVVLGCVAIGLIVVVSVLWIRTGRIQKVRDNFERVSQGQTKQDVLAFLGEPNKTTDCKELATSFAREYLDRCVRVYWYYGGSEIWQVHFGVQDHVVGKQHLNAQPPLAKTNSD